MVIVIDTVLEAIKHGLSSKVHCANIKRLMSDVIKPCRSIDQLTNRTACDNILKGFSFFLIILNILVERF